MAPTARPRGSAAPAVDAPAVVDPPNANRALWSTPAPAAPPPRSRPLTSAPADPPSTPHARAPPEMAALLPSPPPALPRTRQRCDARRVTRAVDVPGLAVLGVPTTAGSHHAGQEKAPAALRSAGLVAAL